MTMYHLRIHSFTLICANCQLLLIVAFDLCRLKHRRLCVRVTKQAESAMRTAAPAGRNRTWMRNPRAAPPLFGRLVLYADCTFAGLAGTSGRNRESS